MLRAPRWRWGEVAIRELVEEARRRVELRDLRVVAEPRLELVARRRPAECLAVLAKALARTKLTLAPGQTKRLGCTIDYDL